MSDATKMCPKCKEEYIPLGPWECCASCTLKDWQEKAKAFDDLLTENQRLREWIKKAADNCDEPLLSRMELRSTLLAIHRGEVRDEP
jgi:hypothetical protein